MSVRLCALICMHSGFIGRAPRVRANDSCYGKGQETKTRHELETTCQVGEDGDGEVALFDIHLTADSFSSLNEQKVVVCGFFGRNALMRLSACYPPEAQQPFPSSLPTRSTVHFPLTSCRSGRSNHLHERIHTGMEANTNRHTNLHAPLPPVLSAGTGADMSEYPGAADPLLCSAALFWSGCCIAGANKGCCHPDSSRLCSHWS